MHARDHDHDAAVCKTERAWYFVRKQMSCQEGGVREVISYKGEGKHANNIRRCGCLLVVVLL